MFRVYVFGRWVCHAGHLLYFRSTGKDELLETAMALHDAAMKDEYFIKRRLAPNVDFWYVASVFLSLGNRAYQIMRHGLAGGVYRDLSPLLGFARLTAECLRARETISGLIYRAMGKRFLRRTFRHSGDTDPVRCRCVLCTACRLST